MSNKLPFAEFTGRYERWRRDDWPRLVGQMTVNHFKENFRRQGFLDRSVSKWKPRKGNTDPGRGVLIKRGGGGGLLGSIRVGRTARSFVEIRAGSERIRYARIHNEGGTIAHPGGSPYIVMKKGGKVQPVYIRKTTAARRKAQGKPVRYTQPHNIRIPKRQYMGESHDLYDQVERKFYTEMNRLWRKS